MAAPACTYSSEEALRLAMREVITPATQTAVNNADLVKHMAAQFEEILKLAKDLGKGGTADAITLGVGFSRKTLATSKLAEKASGSQGLKVANFVVDEMLQSIALIKLASEASPGRVIVTVGTTFVKKTALAMNFGATTKQHKCMGAWLDLGGALGSTGLAVSSLATAKAAAAAGATGFGIPLAVLLLVASAAQLAVAGYKAHEACIAGE